MKTTYDNLFNLAELKKNIKHSEQLFWKHLPDNLDLVCNSHWIAIFKVHPEITGLLYTIFGKDCENDILRITYSGRNKEVSVANVDFGRMLPVMDYEVYDTCFSYEWCGKQLRLFKLYDADVVIAIADRYYKMIAKFQSAECAKPSRVVPILFKNEAELFLVLPVNAADFASEVCNLEKAIA